MLVCVHTQTHRHTDTQTHRHTPVLGMQTPSQDAGLHLSLQYYKGLDIDEFFFPPS
jgi:hypothetical protein